ncbi:MAG TPA: hypothetical protein PLN21_11690 [Gemmatales bacterium]|nr:hypothetical protein [Gemmatales bacterium]
MPAQDTLIQANLFAIWEFLTMKRYLITLAVCAALATPLLADYLVIRINLGADVAASEGNVSPGGAAGGRSGAPAGGDVDDIGGGPSGGAGGRRGAAGGPAGFNLGGAGGAAGAGRRPGGAPGGGGMALGGAGGTGGAGGPAGFNLGGAGGATGSGSRPGGAPGGGGMALGGAGGAGGGRNLGGGGMSVGGAGGRNAPSAGGGRLNPGGGDGLMNEQAAGFVTNKGDLFIVATEVSVTKNTRVPNSMVINHKWGQTVLSPETVLPDRAVMQVIKVPGLESRLKSKRSECLDSGNKQYLKLAEWMIENWNMPAEGKFSMQAAFEAYLLELNSLAANLSAADKARLDTMMAVKTQLAKPCASPTDEIELIKKLMPKIGKDYKSMQKGHFLAYYPSRDDKVADAKLTRLEQAYHGIMYWFALQGKPLPVPAKQMVCIVAETTDKFQALHKMFDEVPMYTSDGFYSNLDNITVIAPKRVDPSYEKFYSMATSAETALKSHNLDFKKLLSERPDRPAINTAGNDNQKLADIVTGQIFALAANAAIDEGEVSTATLEAFRQACAASGYMPRTVILPRSVRDGLASFFSAPKSSGDHNLPALWSGIGGAHWLHLPLFRKMAEARKSSEPSITVDQKLPTRHSIKIGKLDVMAVVTDRVFDKAEKASKDDKDFLMQKAQAESWALTYYLAKSRMAELKKFYDELAQMPRDLELSPEVLEQAFGRAFDLLEPSGEKLDKTKVEKFEADWAKYMDFTNLAVETVEKGGPAR